MAHSAAWEEEDARFALARDPEFPDGPYIRGRLLGQGGYARVYKVLNTQHGGVYAGKCSPKSVKHLRKEARILRSLKHVCFEITFLLCRRAPWLTIYLIQNNIVKYIDYFEELWDPTANVLVLELCAGGSLQTMINNHPEGLTRKDTLEVTLQVARAVEYMHGKSRFHGDLKPRNILIRTWNPVEVVVGDCAEVMHSGKSDDMWAIGISLLGMMSQWPGYAKKEERMYPRRCASHARTLKTLNPDHEIVQLLIRLLEWDHNIRISASELVKLTSELIEQSQVQGSKRTPETGRMDLRTPEGFQTVEFWVHAAVDVALHINLKPPLSTRARERTPKYYPSSRLKSIFEQYQRHEPESDAEAKARGEGAGPEERCLPIVNLGQGFFGYNPPNFILNAAKEALDRVECNQYAPAKGRPRLRKAVADAYSSTWGRQLDPENEIIITTGANEGMLSAFFAFIEPGDEVIVFEPFFDQYISNIQMPGGKVVYVPLHPPKTGATKNSSAADWTIDFEELEKAFTPRTKMIVINTPHNPVGKVFSKEELQGIADLAVKNQVIILSDEVYDRLYYVPFQRIANLSPEVEKITLTVGSAGKNFYATGWRVGWLIGPPELIQPVTAAHTRICFSTPAPFQEAAAIGFEQAGHNGFWDETIKDMKAKVDRLNEVFEVLNLPVTYPEGGYFLLVNMAKVKLPEDYPFPPHVASRPRDFKLAWFLIQEIGVAAIPPTEFYTQKNAHLAEDYIRFAVCKNDEVLEQAKERLRALKKYIQE
ncbi:hypothetical protein FSARC_5691 [Fusarium sarcochroum]|uniref:Protein kinase domain-containing protein n=1 Tax=Fusarium sarcochroum TaxID=1208366 RepID=A0A8H4TZ00_9HYPO|nr:hypothetical protein FSARC_5691 [Fusarium sarcochroum]